MYKINTSKLSQQYYQNITKSSLEITITLSKHHLFNYHNNTSQHYHLDHYQHTKTSQHYISSETLPG